MTTATATGGRLRRLPDAVSRVRERVGTAGAVIAGLFVVGVSVALRTRALDAGFWIDEGLSVGIASHGLFEIPGVLRQDGSPPLYYMLLHLWMRLFGEGEAATHALSVVFAAAAVPAAFWAARAFGPRTAWAAAVLAGLNPFLTYYAQETRMYALVVLLSTLVCGTFLRAFVIGDARWRWPFAVALGLLLYTHNWGLFLAAGTVVALVAVWARSPSWRANVRAAAPAYGAVALAYLPWVPTLVFQALHTGAPWAERPSIGQATSGLQWALGGPTPAIALMLVAGSGLAALIVRQPPADSEAAMGGPASVDTRGRLALALAVLSASAWALAWGASQISPAFTNRYFAVFVGPLLLLAAAGLLHARRLGLAALLVIVVLWFDPRTGALESKSNARAVASSVQAYVQPGDLIVSTHPEQLPLLAYYLPDGARYATSLGPVADERVFDWRDALSRLRRTYPTPTIERLLADMRPGQDLVLVQPIIRTMHWDAPWTELVRRRVAQWEHRLDRHPRLQREAAVPIFGYGRLPRGVRAVVYRVR